MAIDKGPISRDAYRNLATIEDELPREWIIAEQRTQINEQMNDKVKITTVKMPQHINTDSVENPDIFDLEIIDEITTSIGKGGQRSIKDILNFIVLDLVRKNILDSEQKIINLRISGDGRNVGKKIKHVMITLQFWMILIIFTILITIILLYYILDQKTISHWIFQQLYFEMNYVN